MTYKINEICGEGKYMVIPINDLLPNRYIPRNDSDLRLDSLKRSIEIFGIIQPLIVHRVGEKFEIICGELRSLAAKEVGIAEVPAIVYDYIEDCKSILLFSCIENIERNALDMSNIMDSIIKLKDNCVPDEIVLDVFHRIFSVNSNNNN
ncbi:MAG: ParB N-terminal domain-containing protein [Bacillota bacterium]|nr:ParB N-terminal domain-containing protein [Bacillota bacterium]